MKPEYMSYEALVAARDSAEWAYYSMIGTWVAAVATMGAAIVAGFAIFGWRKQEEASELKSLRVSIYNYHMAIIRAPEYNHEHMDQLQFALLNDTYNTLAAVYISTLMIHRLKTRSQASTLYSELSGIQTKYIARDFNKSEAEAAVAAIRASHTLLVLSN